VATPVGFENKIAFVWKIADKLRGHLKPHEYGSVMLPTLVLFRLDAVLEAYRYDETITRLDKAGVLYAVLGDFADIDLHPKYVSNEAMGYIFEELLRKFSEMSNETAGEHYTPREVIWLICCSPRTPRRSPAPPRCARSTTRPPAPAAC
jgi:type I restriction-modification system DNA methylase subunit